VSAGSEWLALAQRAREASLCPGTCKDAWREIQEDFAETVAPGMRLEATVLRSLAAAGEVAAASEGLDLLAAIERVHKADRDFRGNLAMLATLLEELVQFEGADLAAAKARLLATPRLTA
jgi:hypothetical protein